MKTVIYLDVLLLVNFILAWLLLCATGLLTSQRADFGRLALASGGAALASLILFAPEPAYGWQVLYKLATGALVVILAFGVRGWRRFFSATFWYAALNLLLAGLALLVICETATPLVHTANLTVYLRVPPLLLVGLSAGCCAALEGITRLFQRQCGHPQTVGVELTLYGEQIHLRATLDTGCHLKDPIACLPVLLVSFPDAQSRLPQPVREYLKGWYAGVAADVPEGLELRLIPCSTAAGRTLLPGFAAPQLGVIQKEGVLELGRSAVAFTQQSFGQEEYEAIYGQELL